MKQHHPPNISLIVPAYNEEKRIPQTMAALSHYLDENHPGAELIVVCDGCADKTAETARNSFVGKECQLQVIELPENQGKGNAVKQGMLAASGEYLFFTDADLSFEPEVLGEFLQGLKNGADIVVAQRKKETQYTNSARSFVAVSSRWLVGNFVLPGIRDTQAGFKGFKREAAKKLFAVARIKRFLFDLEILLLAHHKGYRIDKVYVDWVDRPGSTVRIYAETVISLRDLLLILFWLATGQYRY
jgi:dolichyl-phosphate beta-glucosyltransferase